MKEKSVFYFVQDACGYLVMCDYISFDRAIYTWRENDCKYFIDKKETDSYISYRLWKL